MSANNDYIYFWNGPFSQWYPSLFKIDSKTIPASEDLGIIMFGCAEQFMMYCKAVMFGDYETAHAILETQNPKEQKALGRKVKNFTPDEWNTVARTIVYYGNLAKFSQNPELLQQLLDTGDTLLVEASPYDTIWGIGLNEEDARNTPPENWKGTNWLGEVLVRVRQKLSNEQFFEYDKVGI